VSRIRRAVNWPGFAVVAFLVLVWHLVVTTGVVDFDFIPDPLAVARALGDLAASGALWVNLRHTLWVIGISSVLACTIGIAVGSLIGTMTAVRTYSMASFDFVRSVPFVAMIPLTLLILGPETHAEIIVATYGACWPMIINTSMGFRQVNPRLGDVARIFQFTRAETFRKVLLPAIMPQLLVGARLAVVSAITLTILAETFVNPAGLGFGLERARLALQPEQMWAYAVVIGCLGYLINAALLHGVRAITPGGRHKPSLARV
jgi:sulfonate transport system permease protein